VGLRQPAERWRDAGVAVALIGTVFVVYRASFSVYFLNEDFTWLRYCRFSPTTGLWTLLSRDAIGGTYSWRPMLQLSFALNHVLWGVNPFGYRLMALVWHAAAACMVYALTVPLTGRWRAGGAATVFAVHPLHVESVSWTCAQGSLMTTAFVLLALLAFVHWRVRGGRAVWVLIPFALALAAQENAVVLPALVVATDVLLPDGTAQRRRRVALYAAMLAVLAGFFWVRRVVSPALLNFTMVGFDPRWPVTMGGLVRFLMTKVGLTGALLLTLDSAASGVLPVVGMLGVAALAWWRLGSAVGLWGLLWIGIAFAPFSLLLLGPVPRYLHLPAAGFALVFTEAVALMHRCLGRCDRRVAAVAVVVVMGLWLGRMVHKIDVEQSGFVARGNLTRAFLLDLLRVLPHPDSGSTLVFHGMGDLRARDGVFIFGLEDAARLFYRDESLRVEFRPLGSPNDSAYHLWYHDGRLAMLTAERK